MVGCRDCPALRNQAVKQRNPRSWGLAGVTGNGPPVLADLDRLPGLDALEHSGGLPVQLAYRHGLHESHGTAKYYFADDRAPLATPAAGRSQSQGKAVHAKRWLPGAWADHVRAARRLVHSPWIAASMLTGANRGTGEARSSYQDE